MSWQGSSSLPVGLILHPGKGLAEFTSDSHVSGDVIRPNSVILSWRKQGCSVNPNKNRRISWPYPTSPSPSLSLSLSLSLLLAEGTRRQAFAWKKNERRRKNEGLFQEKKRPLLMILKSVIHWINFCCQSLLLVN